MKNTFIASILAVTFASSAVAGGLTESADVVVLEPVPAPSHFLGGSIGVEFTENASGNYVATTTLGVGIDVDGLAFGSASVESIDGATFEVDEWFIGTHIGAATLSFGKQGDLFVGNNFEIVGGDTIANPASDHESLIAEVGAAAVMVGFTDITTDISDVENIQGSYTLAVAGVDLTAVGDYNVDAETFTVGAKAGTEVGAVSLGGIVTYADATETFGYEASVGYSIVTAFVNGDDSDALQNVGAGVAYDFNGLNLYAEGTYNVDTDANSIGAGVAFSF